MHSVDKKLKILFMGSPEFAARCLEVLIENGHHISGVITTPDKPKGRGQKVSVSAVKEVAESHGLPLYQPKNLKDEIFQNEIKSLNIDLGIVVAFRMLPESLWSMPKLGTINLHASLLPNYRGAAPINWAIINGEKKTGLTTFFLKHEIDTGDVILQEEVDISNDMSAGELHDELMEKGAVLLSKTASLIESGNYEAKSQKEITSELKLAPKLYKRDGRIDWTKNSTDVNNHIRGLSPYPCAWSSFLTLQDKAVTFKVYECRKTDIPCTAPGEILVKDKQLLIGTGDLFIEITSIQQEGKKRMSSLEFLNGFKANQVSINTLR